MESATSLALASREFVGRVDQVNAEAWSRETPCDGLDVRAVINHVVAGNLFAVRLLGGSSSSEALGGLDGDLLGASARDVAKDSCKQQSYAFKQVDDLDDLSVHHPSGDITAREFLRFRLGDLTVHSWDIARGAGLDEALDGSLVEALWLLVQPVTGWMASTGAFGAGASSDLPPDAGLQTRLLDAFGRRPG